jgi:hypothetical protein
LGQPISMITAAVTATRMCVFVFVDVFIWVRSTDECQAAFYYTAAGSYIESGFHYLSKIASPSYSKKPSIIIRTAGSYIKSELLPEVKPRNHFSSNRNSLVIRTSGSYITKTRLPFLAGKSHVLSGRLCLMVNLVVDGCGCSSAPREEMRRGAPFLKNSRNGLPGVPSPFFSGPYKCRCACDYPRAGATLDGT